MGTAKRERQKANRQLRLQELAREQRKEKSKKVTVRVVGGVTLFVVLVGAIYLLNRDDSSGSASSASTSDPFIVTTTTTQPLCSPSTATTTTADPSAPSTTTPPKPEVKVPGANVDKLKVTVLREGTGTGAKTCDTVVVHYIGVLSTDGKEFDNSYDRGSTFPVTLGEGGVIQGWEDGLVGAKKGSQIQLDIPASLAYGDTGSSGGEIPAGASITFVIDVMDVIPGVQNYPLPTTTTVAGTDTTAAATATTAGADTTAAATSTTKG